MVQNSCLRFSFSIRKYDHVSPFFQRSGWLNVYQHFVVHLCCMTYNILKTNPGYLRELLCLNIVAYSSWFSDTKLVTKINSQFIAPQNFKGLSHMCLENSTILFLQVYAPYLRSLLFAVSSLDTLLLILPACLCTFFYSFSILLFVLTLIYITFYELALINSFTWLA